MRADGGIWTTVYDSAGKVIAKVDAIGYRSTNIYDKTYHPIAIQDSLGNRTTVVYDPVYNIKSVTNARGAITTYQFDKTRRPVCVIDALGNRSTTTYDSVGNIVNSQDAKSNKWTFVFDALNRMVAKLTPLSERTTATFDSMGNPTGMEYPNGERVTRTYDSLDRLKTQTNSANYVMTHVYNDILRTHGVIDFNSNRSTQTFDARWMLSSIRTAENILATFTYDESGNRRSARDGKGQITTFSYNSVNLISEIQDPLSYRTTMTYDLVGNEKNRRDPDLYVLTYNYDVLSRVSGLDYGMNVATMTYDAVGNLTGMMDGQGFVSQTYDLRNALLTKKRGSDPGLTYTYDNVGNRATLVDEAGDEWRYSYDALNRIESLIDPSGSAITYNYDPRGRAGHIRYPNGSQTSYTYDSTSGVRSIWNITALGSPIAVITNALDKAGRTVGEETNTPAIITYSSDRDYRLTRETRSDSGTNPVNYDITYSYDAAGNRTVMIDGGSRTTYSYDERNALSRVQDSFGTTTYQVDNRGNHTVKISSSGRTTYSYDALGRLSRIDTPTASPLATFAFDVFGERIGWTKSGSIVKETWDQASLLSREESGVRTAFFVAPVGFVGDALGQTKLGVSKILVCRAIGTTECLVGSGPSITDFIKATAFGKLMNAASINTDTVLKFCGKLQYITDITPDPATMAGDELLFVRSRFYDPRIGRFTQRNGLGGWVDPQALGNAYSYVLDPVNNVDPFGRDEISCDSLQEMVHGWRDGGQPTTEERRQFNRLVDAAEALSKWKMKFRVRCDQYCVQCSGGSCACQYLEGNECIVCIKYHCCTSIRACADSITHELEHCYQALGFVPESWGTDKCKKCLCMEMQAYNWSGECESGGARRGLFRSWTRRGCVIDGAVQSCTLSGDCKSNNLPTSAELENIYNQCAPYVGAPPGGIAGGGGGPNSAGNAGAGSYYTPADTPSFARPQSVPSSYFSIAT